MYTHYNTSYTSYTTVILHHKTYSDICKTQKCVVEPVKHIIAVWAYDAIHWKWDTEHCSFLWTPYEQECLVLTKASTVPIQRD
jgi:hypothetical protein